VDGIDGSVDVVCDARAVDADEEAAQHSLRRLVCWFDTMSDEWSTRALTRAVARAGRLLVAHQGFGPEHPVAATIAGAEAYLAHPSEQAYAVYFAAATRSYPYGAGEGCYRVDGAEDCGSGSGCRSGGPARSTRSPPW
jgi:hypothetical protein